MQSINIETRNEIERLLRSYCHTLDDGDVDSWSSFFKPDARYQITTRENVAAGYPLGIILCEGKGMLDDRIRALKTANIFESHTYCHITGPLAIQEMFEGQYSVRSNFVVYRTMHTGSVEVFALGKYADVVEVTDMQALISERVVVLDSRCLDTLLVYPL